MISTLGTWFVVATLAQAAPAESSWLKSVPADTDIIVRVRGLENTRDDLIAMIEAMSPTLAQQLAPVLERQLTTFGQRFGTSATQAPFLALIRVVPPEGAASPWAVLVKADNYEGVLSSLKGNKEARTKSEGGGLDSFDGPNGTVWYATKGEGFVAFGPDKVLVGGVAKPDARSVETTLTPTLRERFLTGDLGAYVNLAALTKRYANEIDEAKGALMAALEQAGQASNQAGLMDAAKGMYGAMFDGMKQSDALAFGIDFDAAQVSMTGELAFRGDSEFAKRIATAQPGSGAELGKLPSSGTYFMYMNIDADTYAMLQSMGLRMMVPAGGKPSPELEKALAAQRALGRIETYGSSTLDGGLRGLSIVVASNSNLLAESMTASMKALKDSPGALGIIKDVVVTPDAESFRGIKFTRVATKLDVEKLTAMQPGNPAVAEMIKRMLDVDTMNVWLGTDRGRLVQVVASDWGAAQAELESYYSGVNSVGSVPGYQELRVKLPEKASVLLLLSAQGIVRQLSSQLSAMLQNPNLKAPANLPERPVLIGAAASPLPPNRYGFQLNLPTAAGPIFEKGLVPIIEGMQGRVNQ